MSEETNVVIAEGRHAARTNKAAASNPYPISSMYHAHWEDGFILGLFDLRDELKSIRKHLENAHEENKALKKQVATLTAQLTEDEE
jgi:hypothetical protein